MQAPAARLAPQRRIVGTERVTVTGDCIRRYRAGQSIRSIAADLGRSYGFVHRILTEGGVRLRPRGGAHHAPRRPR